MNKVTSDVLVAALEFAKTLVWPIVAVWVVSRFREQIAELLSRAERLEIGALKVGLKLLEANARQTKDVIVQLSEHAGSESTKFAARQLSKPEVADVRKWAEQHHAKNAWDMGPRNWERCLYDLGFPGGQPHDLEYDADRKLKYK